VQGSRFTRREVLATAGAVGVGFSTPLFAGIEPVTPEEYPKNAEAALERLKAGNVRFVEGKTRHAHEGADWRKQLVGTQKPFATILGCSDSRVPIELVFDQGFGDLFVVRVAGNVIADDVIGSMAYAGLHLHTSLFVVLGHDSCGAVSAALDAKLKKAKEPERIEALLKLIDPALKDLDPKVAYPSLVDAAVEANVRWSLRQLIAIPSARQALERHKCLFVGAVYDLQTGKVRVLK
jgi:carbonic anhydrase